MAGKLGELKGLEQSRWPAVPGWGFAAGVGGLAAFCAFVLPFLAPPGRQVYSAAYAAGSNNKLATVALALLAVGVLWGVWLPARAAAGEAEDAAPLRPRVALTGALLVALWTAGMGAAILHAHVRYGEATYFLERMRDVAEFSPRLYRDIEFPYGPLLLLPGVWAARVLPVSLDAAYWGWLTLLNVAGVGLAWYVLNRMPLGRASRWVLFGLCCFEQMHPLLGPNYSLGKFVLPMAVLVWGSRLRGEPWRAGGLAAGHLLTVLVSPELGVGLAAGIGAWAGLTAWRERQAAPLLCWLAPVAGYAVFLGLYGRGFLDRLGNASAGALNLVIEPLPHTYVLLVALVWLAPVTAGLALRRGGARGPLLAGVFVLSLGLLPGALGRADPLHVYFNGWALLVLTCVGLERLGRARAWVWLAALLVLGVQTQVTNFRIYELPLRALARGEVARRDFSGDALLGEVSGEPVAAPNLLALPLGDELAMRQAGVLPLDYEAGLADLWDAAGEQAKIAQMRQFKWVMMPNHPSVLAEGSPNDAGLKVLLRGGYKYPQRREPFRVGALLEQELATNWAVARRYPDAVLWTRVR